MSNVINPNATLSGDDPASLVDSVVKGVRKPAAQSPLPRQAAKDEATPGKKRNDFSFDLDNQYRRAEEIQEARLAELADREKLMADSIKNLSEKDPLSLEDVLVKGLLEEFDIFRADTMNTVLRDLRVGIITNTDNSRSFLVGKALDNYLMNSAVSSTPESRRNFSMSTVGREQRDIGERYVGKIADVKPGELNPELAARMKKNPELAGLVDYAIKAGQAHGINGVMYANQLWQESRFNPRAQSPAGAMGIAQMMPFQKGKFGLESNADFFDAKKSIDAGAEMMAKLTDRYKDQRLALVAYNGGGKAIDFVESKLGTKQVSFNQWYDFMSDRRETLGTANKSAWHVETLHYTEVIAGKATGPQGLDIPAMAKVNTKPDAGSTVRPAKGPEPIPT